jgi:hypothetical protein
LLLPGARPQNLRKLINELKSDRALILWYVLALAAIGYITLFLALAFIRLRFPYELEWIEGAKIDQMRWILSGKPLYGPPDIHFIPFAYTPLFFYLSAGLMKWMGTGFAAPRLISILSTAGCFLLIYLIVQKDNDHPIPGLVAAGIYAACFALTGAWMDLAKVDSLFMLLILAAFYTSRAQPGVIMAVISGMLFGLAYFTKQLALPVILIFAPLSMVISRGKTWLTWFTAFILGASIWLILDYSSQGWFSFYTFTALTGHTLVSGWFTFWKLILFRLWPTMLLILIFAFDGQRKAGLRRWRWPEPTWQCLGFSCALVLTSWSIFFKIWTYNNDLMPACAGIALLAGLAAQESFSRSRSRLDFPKPTRPALEKVVLGLLVIQFVCLIYNPIPLIPNGKTYQKTEKFIARLESLPGEVFSYNHGFVNYLAGKTTYLHTTPLADVTISAFPPDSDSYQRQKEAKQVFRQAYTGQLFDWVVLDKFQPIWLPYYIQTGNFMRETEANYPGRNSAIIPQVLLTKNPLAQGGELALGEARLNDLFILGWSASQTGERWANGANAALSIALERQASYELQLTARPFCTSGKPAVDRMQVLWNSRRLGELAFSSCAPMTGEFTIPAERLRDQDYNRLSFEFHRSIATNAVLDDSAGEQKAVCFSSIIFDRK